MIKINKGAKPQILHDKAEEWRDELLAKLEAGEEVSDYQKSRYNRPDIKTAIVAETDGKCAYCESKILHVDFGDIEHILPKSERPEFWFEWQNLTLACGVCNNKKRAYYDELLPLLDPHTDDPEGRLLFFGPMARAFPGDGNAQMTERILDLNRPRLLERRTERLDQLLTLATLIEQTPEPVKSLLVDDFRKETESDREYASLARTVARHIGAANDP